MTRARRIRPVARSITVPRCCLIANIGHVLHCTSGNEELGAVYAGQLFDPDEAATLEFFFGFSRDAGNEYQEQSWEGTIIFSAHPSRPTFTVSQVGQGTVEPDVGPHNVTIGSPVQLSADPDPGWIFDKWVVNGYEYTEPNPTVTVVEGMVATAYFLNTDPSGDAQANGAPRTARHDRDRATHDRIWRFVAESITMVCAGSWPLDCAILPGSLHPAGHLQEKGVLGAMNRSHIRMLSSLVGLALVAVVFTGCGLLGGTDAPEPPDPFNQLISLPLPNEMRLTIYRGTAGMNEAMTDFTRTSLEDGWQLPDDLESIPERNIAGFGFSVVPMNRGDQMQLLAFGGAADSVLVGSFIGPSEQMQQYYESIPGGDPGTARRDPRDPDDESIPVDDDLGESVLEIREVVTLIERFSLLEFRVGRDTVRYEYVGIETVDGEDAHRLLILLGGGEFDFWVDMDGHTMDILMNGEAPPPGYDMQEEGDGLLEMMIGFLQSGSHIFDDFGFSDEFIVEEATETRQFGPSSARVTRYVLDYPWIPDDYEIDLVELDDVMLLTRLAVGGEEFLEVTEFELR